MWCFEHHMKNKKEKEKKIEFHEFQEKNKFLLNKSNLKV